MHQDTFRCGILHSVAVLCLALSATSCKGAKTIMIPRFMSGGEHLALERDRMEDPFAGEVFRVDRSCRGREYSLLAVAFDGTLTLGAMVEGAFTGDVVWLAGDLRLKFALDTGQREAEIPIEVRREPADGSRAAGPGSSVASLTGHATRSGGVTTVRFDLPLETLKEADGMLLLRFVGGDGGPEVTLPTKGRLRGVYLRR